MNLTNSDSLKSYFNENGYVVIDTELDHDLLDEVVADVSPYFGENRIKPEGVTYSDHGRIQDAWYLHQAPWRVANSKVILDILKKLYGAKAKPFQTLNFYKGTNQATHADNIHFNSEPFGMMCGVWVAFEDVGLEQGPLRLYPKSNLLPEMNYEEFGLKSHDSKYPDYLNCLQDVIEKHSFTERFATIKKGQAVIWAANILHGGAPQRDMSLTRHSQVTHYYMGEPRAWRPSLSEEGRSYFQPEKVINIKGWGHRLHCYNVRLKRIFGL